MNHTKIWITVETKVLAEIDRLVRGGVFVSRSQVFEVAIKQRRDRIRHSRLARESARLDKTEEQALANERYLGDIVAPEY